VLHSSQILLLKIQDVPAAGAAAAIAEKDHTDKKKGAKFAPFSVS